RIGLAQMRGNVDALVTAVPAALQNDEGLLYERTRWRRRKYRDEGALEIINAYTRPMTYPSKWWLEQNILARRAMEKHNYAQAYKIISGHRTESGSVDYAQAEWLLGWLGFRFMEAPQQAHDRFAS